jgi:hypothetical protein
VKTLLILYVLVAGQTEITVVETQDEQTCDFVAKEMRKGIALPVIDPALPRLVDAFCDDEAPVEAATVPPLELPF